MSEEQMVVKHFNLEQWKEISTQVHAVVFNEYRSAEIDTHDGALMVVKGDMPMVYCTYVNLDKHTCYMQHGGAFPSSKGTTAVHRGYKMMLDYLHERWPRLTTKTRNTNLPMLRLAMSGGFIINGLDVYPKDEIFVRLINDREDLRSSNGSR